MGRYRLGYVLHGCDSPGNALDRTANHRYNGTKCSYVVKNKISRCDLGTAVETCNASQVHSNDSQHVSGYPQVPISATQEALRGVKKAFLKQFMSPIGALSAFGALSMA